MKIFTGKVLHTKMTKTATVVVERIVVHPVYKKRIRRIKKYHVHDEHGVKEGQTVKFAASKPFSKLKRWKIVEVVGSKGKSSKDSGSKANKEVVIKKSKEERSNKPQKK